MAESTDLTAPETANAPWIVIKSDLLDGEEIVFCSGPEHYEACKAAHPDKAIYFAPEVRRIAGWEPETVRMAHVVKRVFGGLIVADHLRSRTQTNTTDASSTNRSARADRSGGKRP